MNSALHCTTVSPLSGIEKVRKGHQRTCVKLKPRKSKLSLAHALIFGYIIRCYSQIDRRDQRLFINKSNNQLVYSLCFRAYAIHALLISSALKVCNFFNFSKRRLGHWSSIRMSSKLLRYYPYRVNLTPRPQSLK